MATFDPDAYLAKTQAFDPDAYLAKGKQKADAPTFGSMMKDELLRPVRAVRDLAAGAVRGAGSIGATLLAPRDAHRNCKRLNGVMPCRTHCEAWVLILIQWRLARERSARRLPGLLVWAALSLAALRAWALRLLS
jgi:hypothetical protein